MSPKIFHICGPLFINVYGLFIALGVGIGFFFSLKDKKLSEVISPDAFSSFILYSILITIAGGRLLFAVDNWKDLPSLFYIIQLWKPGYSVLGAVIAMTIFGFFYLKQQNINPFKVLDRIALYVPLAHSISRFGCYFAGCCYGVETLLPWAVTYTHPDHLAPLGIAMHPTQLYSAFTLFFLFILLFHIQKYFTKAGQLLGLYLMGTGFERFSVDFLRADRTLVRDTFSTTQLVAVIIVGTGLFIFYRAEHANRQ